MDIFLWVVWYATFVPGAVLFELYIMHMFQQNSYKQGEHIQWLQKTENIGRLLGKTLYVLICLPLLAVGNGICLVFA